LRLRAITHPAGCADQLTGNPSDDAGGSSRAATSTATAIRHHRPTIYANKYGGGGYIVDGPPPVGEYRSKTPASPSRAAPNDMRPLDRRG
jgi:hypothetical protein